MNNYEKCYGNDKRQYLDIIHQIQSINTNIDSAKASWDSQIIDVQRNINLRISDIENKSNINNEANNIIMEIDDNIKNITEKCNLMEKYYKKNKNKQSRMNYSIWICIIMTMLSNYNFVVNRTSDYIIYFILILLQIYIIKYLISNK